MPSHEEQKRALYKGAPGGPRGAAGFIYPTRLVFVGPPSKRANLDHDFIRILKIRQCSEQGSYHLQLIFWDF